MSNTGFARTLFSTVLFLAMIPSIRLSNPTRRQYGCHLTAFPAPFVSTAYWKYYYAPFTSTHLIPSIRSNNPTCRRDMNCQRSEHDDMHIGFVMRHQSEFDGSRHTHFALLHSYLILTTCHLPDEALQYAIMVYQRSRSSIRGVEDPAWTRWSYQPQSRTIASVNMKQNDGR